MSSERDFYRHIKGCDVVGSAEELRDAFLEQIGRRPLLYFKITSKKEWAEDVVSGNLYTNPVKILRDIEAKQGRKGQGDIREVSLNSKNAKVTLIHHETGQIFHLDTQNVRLEHTDDKNTPIFCVLGITINDVVIDHYDEESITFRLSLKEDEVQKFKQEFGDYSVLLFPQPFEYAIHKALNVQQIKGFFNAVRYSIPNSKERHDDFFNDNGKRFLYKDIEFSYQREYRLVLNKSIQEGEHFKVGSLAHCSKILMTDDLIDLSIKLMYQL